MRVKDDWEHEKSPAGGVAAHLCAELLSCFSHGATSEGIFKNLLF